MVSADHSTPCINKGHSDDPVPLLVSGYTIKKDDAKRVTEAEAKKGSIGLIEGSQVVETGLKLIKSLNVIIFFESYNLFNFVFQCINVDFIIDCRGI